MIAKLLILIILLLTLIDNKSFQKKSFEDFVRSAPTTLGVTTVTYNRKGDYTIIQSFLDKVAQMQCPIFTELLIIWNNQQSPENVLTLNKDKWKRKVIFHQTPYNSMIWRYKLPQQANEDIYFSIDDEFLFECGDLVYMFYISLYHSLGDIGSTVSSVERSIKFSRSLNQGETPFSEGYTQISEFFSEALPGCALLYRSHFNILFLPNHKGVSKLRKIINQTNRCDDHAYNYIMGHLYPELKMISMDRHFAIRQTKTSLFWDTSYWGFIKSCFTKNIQIFGHNPLPIIKRAESRNRAYTRLIDKYVTYIRQQFYEKTLEAETNAIKQDSIPQNQPILITPIYEIFGRKQLKLSVQSNQNYGLLNHLNEVIIYQIYTLECIRFFIICFVIGILLGGIIQLIRLLKQYKTKKYQGLARTIDETQNQSINS